MNKQMATVVIFAAFAVPSSLAAVVDDRADKALNGIGNSAAAVSVLMTTTN